MRGSQNPVRAKVLGRRCDNCGDDAEFFGGGHGGKERGKGGRGLTVWAMGQVLKGGGPRVEWGDETVGRTSRARRLGVCGKECTGGSGDAAGAGPVYSSGGQCLALQAVSLFC
jgi:hypothetical protein